MTQLVSFAHRNVYLLLLLSAAAMLLLLALPDAAMAKCQPPGVPEQAGSGVPGLLDSRGSPMEGESYYGDYGFAGLSWHACDLGGPIAGNEWAGDPDAMLDTRIGNAGLGLAKWIAAAVTGLHAYNADPSAALQSFDSIVESMSNLVRDLVVDQWMILAVTIAAIMMFVWASTKESRKVIMALGAFAGAVGFLAFVGTYPIQTAQAIDGVASNAVEAADQRALEVSGIDVEPEEAVGAILHDNIMYPLWAKGALGSDDQTEPLADTWANDLYRAGATTYDENDVDQEDKQREYERIYNELGLSEDSHMQTVMKGQGYNRSGVGLVILLMTATVGVIRVLAEVLIFSSVLIFRLIPIIGPIFAILAVIPKTRTIAKMGLNIVGAAAINAVIFGIVAALHTALTGFYANNMDFALMLIFSLVTTFVFWKFTKPFRSLTQMVTPASVGESMSNASNINPMSQLLKAWALFNTGKASGSRDKDSPGSGNAPDEQSPQKDPAASPVSSREHMVNTGPALPGTVSRVPELMPASAPSHPGASSEATSTDLVPQRGVSEPVRHPELGTDATAEQRSTYELAPAAGPEHSRPPELASRPAEQQGPVAPAALPAVPSMGRSAAPGGAQDKDDDADELRDQVHADRRTESRIVGAIDRAAATVKQSQSAKQPSGAQGPSSTGAPEVVEKELPQDIIRMDYDPSAQVYFNPRVDATTRADFNQSIFVPGAETVTRSETVTSDDAQVGSDKA